MKTNRRTFGSPVVLFGDLTSTNVVEHIFLMLSRKIFRYCEGIGDGPWN